MSLPAGNWEDDVFFTEDPCLSFRLDARRISVEISRQNSNLRAVKQKLAVEVKRRGGNALVGFEYGQKSHSVMQQIFTLKWDTESWHGSGYVATLPPP